MRSPGTLNVNDKGFGLLVYDADRPGPRYDSVRIVLEQPGRRAGADQTVLAWTSRR